MNRTVLFLRQIRFRMIVEIVLASFAMWLANRYCPHPIAFVPLTVGAGRIITLLYQQDDRYRAALQAYDQQTAVSRNTAAEQPATH